MKRYSEILKAALAEQPPDYGDGHAGTILEMLYCHYNEFHRMDTVEIKENLEELYRQMNGMPLREMDRIIDTVCALCRDYEKTGFIEGVKIGILLAFDLTGK